MKRKAINSFFLTMFVFGLIVFIYVVVLSFFAPEWLGRQVTHLQDEGEILHPILWWLRNDIIGIIAFCLSAIGFFFWRLTKKYKEDK